MAIKKHISDTAFLVNESRLRKIEISLDKYAEYWIDPRRRERIRSLWDNFSQKVYPYDDIELGVRNRFFLGQLQKIIKAKRDLAFINIAAGFTSYPFLIEDLIDCMEIDYPHVISFKKQRINELISNELLPKRKITQVSADLCNPEDLRVIAHKIKSFISQRASFCLMEGITYYLPKDKLDAVFDALYKIQTNGSIIAFDFWKPGIQEHPVFIRLQKFFSDRFNFNVKNYNLLGDDFIKSIEGYKLIESTDVVEQEWKINQSNFLKNHDDILLENYAVLVRI